MSTELPVLHQTQTNDSTSLVAEARAQRGFINEHTSIADSSPTVDDDQDDEVPEATQTTSAEKRKVDETAKEVQALLPITTFSHASSTRSENETHEQLIRFVIQARIARTRAEALQDVSSTFLRARMVDVHGENKERMLMTKNGEGKFYFAYHSSKMRDVSRETRRAIRETQMSHDAVVIVTERKSRQLTGVSRSPMQRVGTEGNSHLRGDNDYVRVPAKHKGRTTRRADPETTEGLRADPPAGNVDFYNIVYSWCFQIPTGEATSGAILASRLFSYGTKGAKAGVMNPVLQKFSTSKEELRLFMFPTHYNSLRPIRTFTIGAKR